MTRGPGEPGGETEEEETETDETEVPRRGEDEGSYMGPPRNHQGATPTRSIASDVCDCILSWVARKTCCGSG